jgi:hypothetical protein
MTFKGAFKPTAAKEYPTGTHKNGDMYVISGIAGTPPDYTFTGGALKGKVIANRDSIIWTGTTWDIVGEVAKIDPITLLKNMNDVTITSPADDQVLTLESNVWKNKNPAWFKSGTVLRNKDSAVKGLALYTPNGNTDNLITLKVGTAVPFRVSSSGHVGINLSSAPGAALDIKQKNGLKTDGIKLQYSTRQAYLHIDITGRLKVESDQGVYIKASGGALTLKSNGNFELTGELVVKAKTGQSSSYIAVFEGGTSGTTTRFTMQQSGSAIIATDVINKGYADGHYQVKGTYLTTTSGDARYYKKTDTVSLARKADDLTHLSIVFMADVSATGSVTDSFVNKVGWKVVRSRIGRYKITKYSSIPSPTLYKVVIVPTGGTQPLFSYNPALGEVYFRVQTGYGATISFQLKDNPFTVIVYKK